MKSRTRLTKAYGSLPKDDRRWLVMSVLVLLILLAGFLLAVLFGKIDGLLIVPF